MIDPNDLPDLPELMIAGPGELHDVDLAASGHQVIAHYGDVWTALHDETVRAVGDLIGAENPPYVVPGSGTTTLEMAILNLTSPGDRVLVVDTGFFGRRLAEIAKALGCEVTTTPVEVGQPADPEAIAQHAAGMDAVIATHVETSTGVRHPIQRIADAAHRAGAIAIIDGIASAGGEHVQVDGWEIDAFVTATQKGLESPPGLGVLALSQAGKQAIARREVGPRSWCLDVAVWDKYRTDWASWHPHPVTMPTPTFLALASSMKRIKAHGPSAWIEARSTLATMCRDGLASLGFEPVPTQGVGANLVVAAWADDPARVQKHLLAEGLMISGGLGPTHDKAIRVGLMGRTATEGSVARLLDILSHI